MEQFAKTPGSVCFAFLSSLLTPRNAARPCAHTRRGHADRLLFIAAVGDLLVIVGAFLLGFYLRFHSPLLDGGEAVQLRNYSGFIGLAVLTLIAMLASLGFYERHQLLHSQQTARVLLKSWSIWIVALMAIAMAFHVQPSISRVFLALTSALLIPGLYSWRRLLHRVCQHRAIACHLRERVLLVGWNEDAKRLTRFLHRQRHSAYDLAGYIPSGCQSPDDERGAELPCCGEFADLADLLAGSGIDVVILTDVHATRGEISAIADLCVREIVQFQIVPSYFEVLLGAPHADAAGGVPLLGISKLRLHQLGNRLLKRTMDIAGALLGLLLSAPLIAGFGAAVYLESPGSIFYRQRRVGRHGKPFDILKIRSMRLDAEMDGKVGWSTKHDPRRLRIGEFMRRWNIDEVPQFWNVLKGEMSLVGPRPERPELIKNFKHEISHYNARHVAKPGITGWAQINGLRGDTDLTERVRYDLYYMENWSVWFDLQMLFLTFFRRENAC